MSGTIVNIAAYLFTAVADPGALRPVMTAVCQELALKGTVLLTPEGINLFLAGTRDGIDGFLTWLRRDPRFSPIRVKESLSAAQPFRRLKVKVKAEIITLRRPQLRPAQGRAPLVTAQDLKRWLDQGMDDGGRPVVLVDTRNACEVAAGTFVGARHYGIRKFTEFPAAVEADREALAGATVVTFCTGGIRCEKAALFMAEAGFEHVRQLDDGILGYFAAEGDAHYQGGCFVFDERAAVDASLAPMTPGMMSPG